MILIVNYKSCRYWAVFVFNSAWTINVAGPVEKFPKT